MTSAVIIGAGPCGAAAAHTLREEGFDGSIILIGGERHLPYERPPLSKAYLNGTQERESLFIRDASWYQDAGIDMLTSTFVMSIDLDKRRLHLSSNEDLPFDTLLLSTGGRPRPLPGARDERVRYLRSLDDAELLRADLATTERLVVIGAGFIGAEIAATTATLGREVILIDPLEAPLAQVLGSEIGRVFAGIHRDHGVQLLTKEGVSSIEKSADHTLRVRTSTGRVIECDLALVGIGMIPNTELATSAGIKVSNGVLVDELCRTSAEGVYAAGDVANHFHPVFGCNMRPEHHDNALRQGIAAARNMLGHSVAYADCPWFWSDQYDHTLQYTGWCPKWDQLIVRGSLEELHFSAFYMSGGIVRAAVALNRPKDIIRIKKAIMAQTPIDAALLSDESVDLRKL
ncbi:MAG: FAD-dependent oxidoreductase [Actinobacteria bacterium]|nr:FAD-dependent oxidoreductase [Actinomycetota bacterium]